MADLHDARNGHDRAPLRPDETPRHDEHDLALIAAHVAGDLDERDAAKAADLRARCLECEELAADLLAISDGLGAAADLVRPAPRDFRLTRQDAARLSRRSPTSWLGSIAGALFPVARPVGASLAAIGIVGVLVGSFAMGSVGGAASMAAPKVPEPGAGGGAAGAAPIVTTGATDDSRLEIAAQTAASDGAGTRDGAASSASAATGPSPAGWLIVLGTFALAIGLALLAWRAVRERAGP